jgi:hypothetical protein
MDQCRHESAMILFTVMDHDVITSNDFAGESFLSLNSIPGVLAPLPHDINAIDRVDLILMHQQNKGKKRIKNKNNSLFFTVIFLFNYTFVLIVKKTNPLLETIG